MRGVLRLQNNFSAATHVTLHCEIAVDNGQHNGFILWLLGAIHNKKIVGMNARANHGVARHAHKECGGRLVDQVFIQVKLLLYVIIGWTWKAARHRATKKWQVHIGFYDARFRGARGRSCVIAGLAWHALIVATPLRAKPLCIAIKSPLCGDCVYQCDHSITSAQCPLEFHQARKYFTRQWRSILRRASHPRQSNACHVLFIRAKHADSNHANAAHRSDSGTPAAPKAPAVHATHNAGVVVARFRRRNST